MKICLTQPPREAWVGTDHLASCWANVKEGAENGEIITDEEGNIVSIKLNGEARA